MGGRKVKQLEHQNLQLFAKPRQSLIKKKKNKKETRKKLIADLLYL